MVNHPNRSSISAESQPPSPEEIRQARGALSQTVAAALVHSKLRTWQQWEAGDRKMHPGLFELFRLKTKQ